MGSKLSIDKHVSNIEDILEMNPVYFSKLKVENNIPESITQHIKIWRYFEDDKRAKNIKSSPISLKDILDANFSFVSNECYLALFVYKKHAEEALPLNDFPQSMWGVVESCANLTPRGLETPVASSESSSNLNKEVIESFLLPRRVNNQEESKFEYMIFVWNGKTADPLMKAVTLSAALQFDTLISKAKDSLLQVLFSGGYIKNKKLWMGKILQLDSSVTKDVNPIIERKLDPMREAVYLFKFLFPKVERGLKATGFKERFLKTKADTQADDDEYIMIGDNEEPTNRQDYTEELSQMNSPMSFQKTESEYIEDISLENSYRGEGGYPETQKIILPIKGFNIPKRGDNSVKIDVKFTPQSFDDSKSNNPESNREGLEILSIDDNPDSQEARKKAEKKPFNINKVKMIELKKDPGIQSEEEHMHQTESEIKRAIKAKYFEQCNQVVEDFLYVAGEIVAYNSKKLAEVGITHIVNAAGDACENKFADRIKYLTLYLKDSRNENIECIFYETIAFIENARQEGGKVLVHCVQGISRSVALCMSYIILIKGFTFLEAYDHVRKVRGIASPNPAFWAQLFNFQLRVYEPFESLPSPRVFCIGSFQRETPQNLVARLLFETSNLFNPKSYKTLDLRGVFILQTKEKLYVWVGNEIYSANKERYIEKAESYIKNLQKYEHAPQEYEIVNCGEEPEEFWKMWPTEPKTRYGRNKEWDHWFVDLATHKNVQGTTMYEDLDEEKPSAAVHLRPGLYCYPELEPLNAVDMDELMEENLLVLCTQKDEEKFAYLWRGNNVAPEVDDKAYLANVLRQRWPETDPMNIKIIEENANQESDAFMDYFH